MRWWSEIRYRLRAIFSRTDAETELRDELAFHLEMEARKLESEGYEPEEARRLARVRFGGEERFREQARDAWGVSPLLDLGSDLRFAARQLRRRPAFTALAALTLALGIGGTVALASVVEGLLLRPLPVEDEARLVTFWSPYDWRGSEYDFVRERLRAFEDVAAYSDDAATFQAEAGARLLLYSVGSANFFDVLGSEPLLGRTFREGEDRPGAEPVIVLSHGLWEREFGGDREVLGRRVDLGGVTRTVVGVMPPRFFFPSPESEAWIPLDLDPASRDYGGNGWLVLLGRVADGVTPEGVEEEVQRIAAALGERFTYSAQWDKSRNAFATPTREALMGDVRAPVMLLLGAVALVLLTACANVAALLVTRTSDRTGEMSVRTALGAGRGRLARQVLAESTLLGAIAGAAGVVLAAAAFDVLVASLPLPRELGRTLHLDWTTLAAGVALAMGVGALISLAPMHGLLRGDLTRAGFGLRTAGGGTRGSGRLQQALVVAEVLTAVVLVTGTALLMRTVGQLRSIDGGFEPEGVMTVEVILPEGEGADGGPAFFTTLLERVRALPGVTSAGLTNRVPVRDGGWQGSLALADRPELEGDRRPSAFYRPSSPGAFEALGLELAAGRTFTELDGPDQPLVAIVNETLARTLLPGQSAVGRIIDRHMFHEGPIEIVGVVRNVAVDDLIGEAPMAIYYPWDQTPSGAAYGIVVIKSELAPEGFVEPVRRIVAELAPRAALGRAQSMDDVLDDAMAEPLRLRFFLGLFSLLGVVLGTVGVYGIVSYSVQRRRAEYGVRMALGARPSDLVHDVVRSGIAPVVLGILAGALVAWFASSVLAGFLFGVEPTDPASLTAAGLVLLVAGVVAALVPAMRAAATDPSIALRD